MINEYQKRIGRKRFDTTGEKGDGKEGQKYNSKAPVKTKIRKCMINGYTK